MELEIEYVRPDSLNPAPYNPRTIRPRALRGLAALMDRHGFVDPVIARRSDRLILGGHQRLAANALRADPDALVPVVFLDGIDDDHAKALNVALNNPGVQGRFDLDKLAAVVGELSTAGLELPELTGLDPDEIADLTADAEGDVLSPVMEEGPGAADAVADLEPVGPEPQADVVLVFELSREQYADAKKHFDHLIATHNLPCRVRMEDTG